MTNVDLVKCSIFQLSLQSQSDRRLYRCARYFCKEKALFSQQEKVTIISCLPLICLNPGLDPSLCNAKFRPTFFMDDSNFVVISPVKQVSR